ncbi:hypothetical protein QF002_005537 [Paraburkholderia youngii]
MEHPELFHDPTRRDIIYRAWAGIPLKAPAGLKLKLPLN